MLLTAEEYGRGLVKWTASMPSTVSIVADVEGESGRMSDSEGSVPDVDVTGGFRFTMLADDPTLPIGYWGISWDRSVDGEIRAFLAGGPHGDLSLMGGPAPGRFERLILSVPYLLWGSGWAVRAADVIVRFTNSVSFEGFQTDSVEHGERESTFVQTFSTQRREGSFVEIIAPEVLGDHREIAFAVASLLSLVFGDAAIGDVVTCEPFEVTPAGTAFAARNPMYAVPSAPNLTMRMPIEPPRDWLENFDRLLSRFIEDAETLADTALPLRWYERAVRTGSSVDKFLAAFVGIEALIGTLGRRLPTEAPFAAILRDARVPDLLEPLRADYPEEHVNRLLERLQNRHRSLQDRFGIVATSLNISDEQRAVFGEANDARNALLHGRSGTIHETRAPEAVELLADMLKEALNERPNAGEGL